MSMTREELKAEVLGLSPEDREWMLEHLITSLDGEGALSEEWRAELARRVEEVESGVDEGIPGEEGFAEARARLAKMRAQSK